MIPNFIDLRRFNKQRRDHFRRAIAPNNERLVVHASNFRPVKRVGDVVKVFHNISKVIPSKLLMIGDGPERDRIEKECRETSDCENIRFLGKIDVVEEILSICDLFVLPSESESFGLAALEAMACQVPVISTNTGGLPEVIKQGYNGFMSNVGDIEDMSKNAIHILEDTNRLMTFKSNALSHAKTFDITNVLPIYEALYKKVLDESNSKN